MAEPEFGRKPLAIQRILSENVGSCRVKSQSRVTVEGKSDYQDKENGEDQDQDEEAQETDWCPEAAAMSSTMAVSTLSTPRFFSMSSSNMSSINFSDPSFSEICQEKHFKTPNLLTSMYIRYHRKYDKKNCKLQTERCLNSAYSSNYLSNCT